MRKFTTQLTAAFLLFVGSITMHAQLSGIYNIPGDFASLAAAISSLNAGGVSGPVTINIAATTTETAPVGGYTLTATGSSVSPLIFQKSGIGANPLITAYTGGSGTPATAIQDGVITLVGSDYVTFDGIDIVDPNTSNPATMEYGYGFFKASATDGCQNNTIKNCVITLSRANNAAGSGPSIAGSKGINLSNAIYTTQTTAVSVSAASGANANNKFYSNTIQNCNIGIVLSGYNVTATSANSDTGNDIGGTSAATGNTIINYGGGGTTSAAYGVYTIYQQNLNVAYNTVNNNNGSGVNHASTSGIYGIYLGNATSGNASVLNNTVTTSSGAASAPIYPITNAAGATPSSNTVSINNNIIANCNNTITTTGTFYGIYNTASPAYLYINNNTFTNNIIRSTTASIYEIYNNMNNSGSPTSLVSVQNNTISNTHNGATAHTGAYYGIDNYYVYTSTLTVSGNNFTNVTRSTAGTTSGYIYWIYNYFGTRDYFNVDGNTWSNISLSSSYYHYFMYNYGANVNYKVEVMNNGIVGSYSRGTGNNYYTYCVYNYMTYSSSCLAEVANNNFSNISFPNGNYGYFYGIYQNYYNSSTSPYHRVLIHDNIFSNININCTSTGYYFYGIYAYYYMGSAGTSSGSAVYSNTITNVNFGSGGFYGMYCYSYYNAPGISNEVHHNTISNITTGYYMYGMYLSAGPNSSGAPLKVYSNKIYNLTSTSSSSPVYGMYASTSYYINIYNNMVGKLYTNYAGSTTAPGLSGIYVGAGYVNVHYNTVYLDATSNINSAAVYLYVSSSSYIPEVRNNIIINKSTGTGKIVALWRSASTLNYFSSASNNNLYYAGTPSANNLIHYDGTNSHQTLAAYQSFASPIDAQSVTEATTPFLNTTGNSANFLHINPIVPGTVVESGAVNITGITNDFDSDIRQGNSGYVGTGTAPDIGADETTSVSPCSSANAGTVTASTTSLCEGQPINFSSDGFSYQLNTTYQWQMSTVSGGPYSPVSGGNGSNTPLYVKPAGLAAGTWYFVFVTTCTSIPVSNASNEVTVTVSPAPSASATASPVLLCAGSDFSLTGTSNMGSASYSWSGPNGYTSLSQNPVISPSLPSNNGVYTLSTFGSGCSNPPLAGTNTVMVTVSNVTAAISPSHPLVCVGSPESFTLNSSGTSYTWSTGQNTQSITINPTLTTIYTATAQNVNGCIAIASYTMPVINATLSLLGDLGCDAGLGGSGTLTALSFTPSTVKWYSSPTSTSSPLGTSATNPLGQAFLPVNYAPATTTIYAQAFSSGNLCLSSILPVVFTVSPQPTISIVSSPAINTTLNPISVCSNDTYTLTASGAASYTWSNILSMVTNTDTYVMSPVAAFPSYTVTGISSAGCTNTTGLTLSIHTSPVISMVASSNYICQGDNVIMIVSGNATNSYSWTGTNSSGPLVIVTPSTSTNYAVLATSQDNCTTSVSQNITVSTPPVINVISATGTICAGESVNMIASGATTYSWVSSNGYFEGAAIQVYPNTTTTYYVTGVDQNGCAGYTSFQQFVDACTGIAQLKGNAEQIKVYPNPNNGMFTVELNNGSANKIVELSDLTGRVVLSNTTNEDRISVDMSQFSNGVYYLKVKSNNSTSVVKVVKQ